MSPYARFFVPLAVLAVSGCALSGKPVKSGTLPEEIQNSWIKAFNSRDHAALQAVYAEDCVLLPPNRDIVRGPKAAVALFADGMAEGLTASEVHAESKVVGDLAYRYGTYQTKDASGVELERGNYFEIWRKGADGWKMSRDIWNSTLPLPPDNPAQQ